MQIIFIFYKNLKNAKYMYILYFLHKRAVMLYRLGLWYLMPLSTIFQLYRGGFIGGGNRSTRRKPPTCRKFSQFFCIRMIIHAMSTSFRFTWELPVWSLPRKNKEISPREVGTHMNADCLLKNVHQTKYVVNQKLKHFNNISFIEHIGRTIVGFSSENKIWSFLSQCICIRFGPS